MEPASQRAGERRGRSTRHVRRRCACTIRPSIRPSAHGQTRSSVSYLFQVHVHPRITLNQVSVVGFSAFQFNQLSFGVRRVARWVRHTRWEGNGGGRRGRANGQTAGDERVERTTGWPWPPLSNANGNIWNLYYGIRRDNAGGSLVSADFSYFSSRGDHLGLLVVVVVVVVGTAWSIRGEHPRHTLGTSSAHGQDLI